MPAIVGGKISFYFNYHRSDVAVSCARDFRERVFFLRQLARHWMPVCSSLVSRDSIPHHILCIVPTGSRRSFFFSPTSDVGFRYPVRAASVSAFPFFRQLSRMVCGCNRIPNALLMSDPSSVVQLKAEYEAANHIATNGKSYTTLRAWKFNSLLYEYKQSHPFE